MKKGIYYASTGLLLIALLGSAVGYVVQSEFWSKAIEGLGYGSQLLSVLFAVKVLAVAAIVVRPKAWISDLAYAGVFYLLILAAHSHVATFGVAGIKDAIPALFLIAALVASFLTQNAVRKTPSPYVKS